MANKMYGIKIAGRVYLSKRNLSIRPIEAEKAGVLRQKGKMSITFAPTVAIRMANERNKRVIHQLPNGVFGVMT